MQKSIICLVVAFFVSAATPAYAKQQQCGEGQQTVSGFIVSIKKDGESFLVDVKDPTTPCRVAWLTIKKQSAICGPGANFTATGVVEFYMTQMPYLLVKTITCLRQAP